MTPPWRAFLLIMGFYIVLSYLVGPVVGYYASGQTLQGAGHGFAVASALSIVLWYAVGRTKV